MSRSQRSQAPAAPASILHQATSRRLAAAQLTSSPSSSRSSSSFDERPQVYPSGDFGVLSTYFEVDFNRVSDAKGRLVAGRLVAGRLGYRVTSTRASRLSYPIQDGHRFSLHPSHQLH
jgi:hypothetical protein